MIVKNLLPAILFVLLTLTACGKDSVEVKKEIPKDLIIIDVRTKAEYDNGHLKDALLIPFNVIGDKIAEKVPDKEAHIALYCRSGRRSGIALNTLKKMGYTNAENYGGLQSASKQLSVKIVE